MATEASPPIRLERAPLRDQVRELLTARIFDGTYGPGERLVETRIAAELGVSQAPVREALRELETLRLVEHAPFRGARVRELHPGELLAVFPVRIALETLAAKMAHAHLSRDCSSLVERLEAMREAAKEDDAHALIANDVGFHAAIVEAAKNQPLLDAWNALGVEGHAYVTISRLHLGLAQTAELHVPILEACQSGNAAKMARAIKTHLDNYAQKARADATLNGGRASQPSETAHTQSR